MPFDRTPSITKTLSEDHKTLLYMHARLALRGFSPHAVKGQSECFWTAAYRYCGLTYGFKMMADGLKMMEFVYSHIVPVLHKRFGKPFLYENGAIGDAYLSRNVPDTKTALSIIDEAIDNLPA